MSYDAHSRPVDPATGVKISRMLVGAMLLGITSFALVIEFVLHRQPRGSGIPDSVLLLGTGALLVGGLGAAILIPQHLLSAAVRRCSGKEQPEVEGAMARAYLIACILRAAFLEGPALMGLVTVLLTGNALGYVAAGVAMLVLMVTFPSRSAMELLIERALGRGIVLP